MLTIGMAVYDDYDGVFFTLKSIQANFPRDVDIELLVVDNNPSSTKGKMVEDYCSKSGVKYVPFEESVGTSQTRNKVIESASNDWVICVDSHVVIPQASLTYLMYMVEAGLLNDKTIYHGPLVLDDNINCYTHMNIEWRGGMLGTWGQMWYNPETAKFDMGFFGQGEKSKQEEVEKLISEGYIKIDMENIDELLNEYPEEIPAHGLGLFMVNKSYWPGFNERFRGFGGEEVHIHRKYRRMGGKVKLNPCLAWHHRFERPDGPSYPLYLSDRIRNYYIGHNELGKSPSDITEHFSAAGVPKEQLKLNQQEAELGRICETPRSEFVQRILDIYVKKIESAIIIEPFATHSMKTVRNLSFLASIHLNKSTDIEDCHREVNNGNFNLTWRSHYTGEDFDGNLMLEEVEDKDSTDLLFWTWSSEEWDNITDLPRLTKRFLIVDTGNIDKRLEFASLASETGMHIIYYKEGVYVLSYRLEDKHSQVFLFEPEDGVGTNLAEEFEAAGFVAEEGCHCVERTVIMNREGLEWCIENRDKIVEWVMTQARKAVKIIPEFVKKRYVEKVVDAAIKKERERQKTIEPGRQG